MTHFLPLAAFSADANPHTLCEGLVPMSLEKRRDQQKKQQFEHVICKERRVWRLSRRDLMGIGLKMTPCKEPLNLITGGSAVVSACFFCQEQKMIEEARGA